MSPYLAPGPVAFAHRGGAIVTTEVASEQEWTSLEIRLLSYRPAGESGSPARNLELVIPWRGLRGALREFAGDAELSALDRALRDIRALRRQVASGGR